MRRGTHVSPFKSSDRTSSRKCATARRRVNCSRQSERPVDASGAVRPYGAEKVGARSGWEVLIEPLHVPRGYVLVAGAARIGAAGGIQAGGVVHKVADLQEGPVLQVLPHPEGGGAGFQGLGRHGLYADARPVVEIGVAVPDSAGLEPVLRVHHPVAEQQ